MRIRKSRSKLEDGLKMEKTGRTESCFWTRGINAHSKSLHLSTHHETKESWAITERKREREFLYGQSELWVCDPTLCQIEVPQDLNFNVSRNAHVHVETHGVIEGLLNLKVHFYKLQLSLQ